MRARQILLYFAWSHPAETSAPLGVLDDRFPAIFELRRLFYPKFEQLSDGEKIDQGIAGFLDHIQKPNFQAFAEQTEALTGRKVVEIERINKDGAMTPLDGVLEDVDSIVLISFDSIRTEQTATTREVEAVRNFLDNPDHLVFVCPHHDIGEVAGSTEAVRLERQLVEYRHHGDHAIPPRQGFGGFARTLLAGLGVPVENRFGLRPAATADGAPAAVGLTVPLTLWACCAMSAPFTSIRTCRNSSELAQRSSGWTFLLGRESIRRRRPTRLRKTADRASMHCCNRGRKRSRESCWSATRRCSARPPAASRIYAASGPI